MDSFAPTEGLNMYSNVQNEASSSSSQVPRPKGVRSLSNENTPSSVAGVTKPKQSKSRNGEFSHELTH